MPSAGLPAILLHSSDRLRFRAFRSSHSPALRFEAQFGHFGKNGDYQAPPTLTAMGIDRITVRSAEGKPLASVLVQMEPRTQPMFPDRAPAGAVISNTRHAPAPGVVWPGGIRPVRDVRSCRKTRIAGVMGREIPLRMPSSIRLLAVGAQPLEWTIRRGLSAPPTLKPVTGSVKTIASEWDERWDDMKASSVHGPNLTFNYRRMPARRVRYLDRFVADGRRWRHIDTRQEIVPGWFAFGFMPVKDRSGRPLGRTLGYDARGLRWMPEGRKTLAL